MDSSSTYVSRHDQSDRQQQSFARCLCSRCAASSSAFFTAGDLQISSCSGTSPAYSKNINDLKMESGKLLAHGSSTITSRNSVNWSGVFGHAQP